MILSSLGNQRLNAPLKPKYKTIKFLCHSLEASEYSV